MLRLASALVLASLAGTAIGQTFNIDMNVGSGAGAGAPANRFPGVAGITGVWNAVTPASAAAGTSVSLVNTAGAATGVMLKHYANSASGQGNYGTGDFARLMGDFAEGGGATGQAWMEFSNLQPGLYRVWVLASLPPGSASYIDSNNNTAFHPNNLSVSLNNAIQSITATLGVAPADTFVRGTNYQVVTVPVASSSDLLRVLSICDSGYFAARTAINGVQLERWTGTRVYVNDNAAGLGTGRDWDNAINSLQEAIEMARESNGLITEIWVAGGFYKPGTFRTSSFKIPNGVKLYGGFAGTESTLAERVLGATPSTLSGDIGAGGVTTDNTYHVVDVSDTFSSTRLDGFTISSGYADGSASTAQGGAMTGDNAALKIANCRFVSNYAEVEGGAMYFSGNSRPWIVNCVFQGNTAGQFGGAIRNTSTDFSVTAVNCTFAMNVAGTNGGAINTTGSLLQAIGCVFVGNSAQSNGGAMYVFGASADAGVRNCTFSANRCITTPTSAFGGIGVGSGARLDVMNSILWSNTDSAPGTNVLLAQVGGAPGTTILLTDNIIEEATIFTGTRNLGLNPMFVDQFGANNIPGDMDDDLRLSAASPAIDSGNNTQVPTDFFDADDDGNTLERLPMDRAGLKRQTDDPNRADTGIGTAPIVDRGAYEFQPVCPADFNGDQSVDFFDYLDFVASFDSEAPEADFNDDGAIDFFDYLDFVAAFDAGCD